MPNKKPAITSISIENFKGIGSRVTIPLKPLMLFYGPNSAGKSTVIEALLLANEVMNGRNPNVDKVKLGGDLIRLGGFQSYVHGKNIDKPVIIRLDMQPGENGLPGYETNLNMMMDPSVNEDGSNALFDLPDYIDLLRDCNLNNLIDIQDYFIEFRIEFKGQWVCVGYKAGINNEWIVETEVHSAFPIFPVQEKQFDRTDLPFSETCFDFNANHPAMQALCENDGTTKCILEILDATELEEPRCACRHDFFNGLDLTFDKPICLQHFDSGELTNQHFEYGDIWSADLKMLSHITSQLLVGGREIMAGQLSSHVFIGPFRSLPERGIDNLTEEDISWADGSAAWAKMLEPRVPLEKIQEKVEQDLENVTDELFKDLVIHIKTIEGITNWQLSKPNFSDFASFMKIVNYCLVHLGLNQQLIYIPKFPLATSSSCVQLLARIVNSKDEEFFVSREEKLSLLEELKEAPYSIETKIKDNKTGKILDPRDVGSGVAQVIPVIVAIFMDAVFKSIEQPELHLHPAAQCGLGDLLIGYNKTSKQDENCLERRILVETHSEHLLLRILRRMRETANGTNTSGLEFDTEDLAVFAVECGENGTEIYEMEISEEGELLTPWPNGFFPERMQEILGE